MTIKVLVSELLDEEMQPEYDFSKGVRGKFAGRFAADTVLVPLDPDVAAVFHTAAEVNEALRLLIKTAAKAKPAA